MLSHELIKKFQIFSQYPEHTLEEFGSILQVSRRQLLTDIARINESLARYGFPQITCNQSKVGVPHITETSLFERLMPEMTDYLFQAERPAMLTLYLLLAKDFVAITHLESFVQVSRNSILTDLKLVRKWTQDYGVQLVYTRQEGYYFVGDGLALRRLLEATIAHLLTYSTGKWLITYVLITLDLPCPVEELHASLLRLGNRYGLVYIAEKMRGLAYVLALLSLNPFWQPLPRQGVMQKEAAFSQIALLLADLLKGYPSLEQEAEFILTRLIGCIQGDLEWGYHAAIYQIMEEIIQSVSVNTGLVLNDTPSLRKNLYSHLLPAYYRIYYDVELHNPLKDQIKSQYASLFYLVKRSLSPLEKQLGKAISEDEVAYFTIHFGGRLEKPKASEKTHLVALCVCPNGISSSLMLHAELKQLFPQLQFIEIHQLDKIALLDASTYDLVFSTVHFPCQKPVYVTQPIMGAVERLMLKKMVCRDFNIPLANQLALDELLAIIDKHATINNQEELAYDLSDYLIGNHFEKEIGGLGLLELLTEDFIQQETAVSNWQEAISLAARPLLEHGFIEKRYIEGMIASVNELGAYIVLAPKVAVPHAAPEQGVHHLGMSLLQLKHPVSFDLAHEGDNDKDVQLIFVLAAVDSTAHLKALQELAMILEDDEQIAALIAAPTKPEILAIIRQIIEEGDA
ncbi:BglG family transcription antiterminator [Streptococcus halichoeri]|uniref:BglG family transcription antiterminator n=1 Tax=Streptococcus halichoeri TaxID=254785 RepID=UPI00135AEB51|nr:BglG family transcription antiterminator [Streptococcus halichoeri]